MNMEQRESQMALLHKDALKYRDVLVRHCPQEPQAHLAGRKVVGAGMDGRKRKEKLKVSVKCYSLKLMPPVTSVVPGRRQDTQVGLSGVGSVLLWQHLKGAGLSSEEREERNPGQGTADTAPAVSLTVDFSSVRNKVYKCPGS